MQSEQGKGSKESAMSTLHGIRKFALITMMATGALTASVTQAETCAQHAIPSTSYADLGQVTVTAPRFAELGSMVVSAQRLADTRVADLGAITVTAPRLTDIQVADLGSLTVTATRFNTVLVAAQPSNRSWE